MRDDCFSDAGRLILCGQKRSLTSRIGVCIRIHAELGYRYHARKVNVGSFFAHGQSPLPNEEVEMPGACGKTTRAAAGTIDSRFCYECLLMRHSTSTSGITAGAFEVGHGWESVSLRRGSDRIYAGNRLRLMKPFSYVPACKDPKVCAGGFRVNCNSCDLHFGVGGDLSPPSAPFYLCVRACTEMKPGWCADDRERVVD